MNITHGRALKILSGNDEMERGLKISSFIQELTAVEQSPPNIFFSSREIIISGLTCPPHCEHHTDNTQQLLLHCFSFFTQHRQHHNATVYNHNHNETSEEAFKSQVQDFIMLQITGSNWLARYGFSKGDLLYDTSQRNQQPILLNCNVWLTLKQHYFFL